MAQILYKKQSDFTNTKSITGNILDTTIFINPFIINVIDSGLNNVLFLANQIIDSGLNNTLNNYNQINNGGLNTI